MATCGIYSIENIKNKRMYIGSSINIEARFERHKDDLRAGIHHSRYLQRAWNKYGKSQFRYKILEVIKDPEKLIEIEQAYIDSHKNLYNMSPTASNCLGVKHTQATKEKQSIAKKGKQPHPNSLANLWHLSGRDSPNKGRKHSEETKAKRSAALKGIPRTEEWKRKISEAQLGEKGPRAKITEKQAIEILKRLGNGEKQYKVAEDYGVTKQTISHLWCGQTWKHIDRGVVKYGGTYKRSRHCCHT